MKLLEVIPSKIDNTIKYVFNSNNSILEFSYINKNDGKDIICVPTQTSCKLGCKFCFLTGLNLPVRNLTKEELLYGIYYIYDRITDPNDILLISYMGCGEPLLNIDNVIQTSIAVKHYALNHNMDYDIVRFAIASLIPSSDKCIEFMKKVIQNNLLFKFHYSLHYPFNDIRKQYMPAATLIEPELEKLEYYHLLSGNSVEIHYSLMDGINDRIEDAYKLIELLKDKHIPIKILKLSEKKDNDLKASTNLNKFIKLLDDAGIKTEYYEPPGIDVGSSCGQFLLDYYEQYNEK